jgi:hypothetical protein
MSEITAILDQRRWTAAFVALALLVTLAFTFVAGSVAGGRGAVGDISAPASDVATLQQRQHDLRVQDDYVQQLTTRSQSVRAAPASDVATLQPRLHDLRRQDDYVQHLTTRSQSVRMADRP